MKATVCRKAHFNAAHRIFNPAWDDRKNEEVFGLCSLPNYHGHNYDLVVKLTGEISPDTGYVFDMKVLKEIIDEHVVRHYDHKNLNLDVADFASLIPSAENIAVAIWNRLRSKISSDYSLAVVLYETERNFVEYSGDDTAS
ncbi:MAG TPA: 6-carboxytetrahydropterin synthase [Bacteroidales bacterium]|nr:6-carboxytetrahydropterin synthase [Bacteroidales bacterium]